MTGCSQKEFNVVYTEQIEFEKDIIDVCTLIQSIDDYQFAKNQYLPNKINSKDFKVTCKSENVRKLGDFTSTVNINGVDKKLVFNVKDTISPKLEMDDSFEVEVGNTFFDIKKQFVISDNYSPLEKIEIFYTGKVNVEEVGEYKIKIVAKDENNNEITKDVVVNVIEKEKEVVVVEVPVVVPGGGSSSTSNGGQTSNTNTSTNSNATSSVNSSDFNRNYLFADGYDLNTAQSSCSQELNRVSSTYNLGGSCNPIKDGNIYIGYSLVFY